MKTTPISATILALALFSTQALAQDKRNTTPQEKEWFSCWSDFHNAKVNLVAVREAMPNFDEMVLNHDPELNAKDCVLMLRAIFSIPEFGNTCVDLANHLPKNSPNRKFITKTNKEISSETKAFQKVFAALIPICKELEEKEDASRK